MARSGGQNSTFRGDDLPDYANRVDLFSFVAARMKQERNHAPLYDQMMHYCREYYDHVRMKADNVVHIIEQTVRDGILVRRKDRIGFRFNSIFSFFVAQRMKVDPAFYDSILREPSANALDICIYCGLNRNDANVLDIIREYLTALFDRLAAECGGSLPDVNYVNTYHPPRVRIVERMMAAHLGGLLEAEGTAELRHEFAKHEEEHIDQMVSRTPSKAERAKLEQQWQAALERLGGNVRTIAFDRRIQTFNECLGGLQLYGTCIKNLQQIAGEKKVEHVRAFFKRWAASVSYMLAAIQFLTANFGKFGKAFRPLLPDASSNGVSPDDSAVSVRPELLIPSNGVHADAEDEHISPLMTHVLEKLLVMFAPAMASTYIKYDLGTERLDRVLLETDPDDFSDGEFYRVLLEVLIMDMRLSPFLTRLRKLLPKLNKDGLAWQYLTFRLPESFIKYPIKDKKTEQEFRDVLANMLARQGGFRKAQMTQAANILKQRLEQKRTIELVQTRQRFD